MCVVVSVVRLVRRTWKINFNMWIPIYFGQLNLIERPFYVVVYDFVELYFQYICEVYDLVILLLYDREIYIFLFMYREHYVHGGTVSGEYTFFRDLDMRRRQTITL